MSGNYPYGGPGGQPSGNYTGFQQQQPQQPQSFGGYQQPTGLGYQPTGYQPQQQPQQQSFGSFQQNPASFGIDQGQGQFQPQQQFGQSTVSGANGPPAYATAIDQLSFLTPQDQQKFRDLFNGSTSEVSISPESARGILLKSNLGPSQLARIWDLSDLNKSGDLLFPEFALALHLCNVALRGNELPYVLDSRIKDEVTTLVDKISFSIPEESGDNSQQNRPVPKPNVSASNIFAQPQAAPQNNYQAAPNLTSQPTGFGFGNSITSQSTGFQNIQQQNTQPFQPQSAQPTAEQSQPSTFQPQTQRFQGLNSNPTGFQQSSFSNNVTAQPPVPAPAPFQPQATGFQPLQPNHQAQPQQQQPQQQPQQPALTQQPTGIFNEQQNTSAPAATNGLTQQPTGLIPLKTQGTGAAPQLQQQRTGLVPLQNQATGTNGLQQQPTGLVPLQGQLTGGQPLKQQPTGLIPLQNQATGNATGGLNRQPTGLIPLQNQATGSAAPLQQTPTGGAPLTHQPTGLVPLATTATGSVALQTQLTGPAPLQSQRTGFGNFEPLRQQKTGVGQNSLFLQNLLQQQQQPQQPQQQLFSNSLNYTNETISPQEKQLFNKIFQNYDTNRKGLLTAEVSAEIFRKSGLNRSELEQVWDLVTRPNQSHLDKESFQTGMWLIYKRLNGFQLPDFLPESLKPQSIKILDDVKNQLKINPSSKASKKSSNSRIDGTRFKNNDEDFALSSSRNRRRTTKRSEPGQAAKPKENLSIEEIKKRIREKKILLDAFDATGSDLKEKEIDYEKEDQEAIIRLKQEILSLPNVNNSGGDQTSFLKQKFNALTSKVPVLINEIAQVDNEITRAKLSLYKIKNPSFIIGSGPNGEVTEGDRRKAKSKALLAAKMAKLTGKPIDPEVQNLTDEQGKLDEEASRIQEENKKNQQIIRDVESSIKEISGNVLNSFSSQNDREGYKKWELGIGVQPEVQELIKSFRVGDLSNRFTKSLQLDFSPSPAPSPQYSSPAIASPQLQQPASPGLVSPPQAAAPVAKQTTSSGSSSYKTPEERKAYIREQAKKKMNERLAKFGISRNSSQRSPTVSSPTVSSPVASPPVASPPVASHQPVQHTESAPVVPGPQPVQLVQKQSAEDESSDDDDEEEFQRMEDIRRLKRAERDQRIAQLGSEEAATEPEPAQESRKFHDSNPFAFK